MGERVANASAANKRNLVSQSWSNVDSWRHTHAIDHKWEREWQTRQQQRRETW